MGFLSRSKSLRRQQSTLNTSRSDKSEEERFYSQRQQQRSAVNVNAAQDSNVRSARLDARFPKDPPRPGTANRPPTSSGKSQRANPLPIPDKGPLHPSDATKTQTIEIKADSHIYRFPTPSPSTPRGSPSHASHPSHTSSDATIGIALGSPRFPPQQIPNSPRALPEAPRASPLRTFSEPLRTPKMATPITPTAAEPTKLRKSKSRSFKNMFSSKSAKQNDWTPPVPASHWQLSTNASREDTSLNSQRSISSNATSASASNASYTSYSTKASTVSNTSTSRPVHARNDSSHATAYPRQQARPEADKTPQEKPKIVVEPLKAKPVNMQIFPTVQTLPPIRRGNYTEIRIPQLNQDALDTINQGTGGQLQSSFLNVDIPKSEMERYSVMFEKLLKPQTSIAERRGTLKRLRPLGEETTLLEAAENTPRRRATSPSMPSRPSPGLRTATTGALPQLTKPSPKPSPGREIIEKSIQETNKNHMEAANRLLQLQRSRTTPAMTVKAPPISQPIPKQFTRDRGEGEKEQTLSAAEKNDSPASPLWSEASLPITPDSSVAQTFFSVEDDEDDEIITQSAVVRMLPKIEPGLGVSAPPPPPPPTNPTSTMDTGPREHDWNREGSGSERSDKPGPKRMDSLDPQDGKGQRREERAAEGKMMYGQVGVARTVSLSRAKNARTPVTSKQPLRPRVVDVDARRSQLGLIEQV
ncbi:hypothetical protein CAC42_8012 [Sphaceloma murrayae]|uniref:Uncharacterized protein n=1 Tax=Sphaceloma murrayae TaxID=2082308 RepID=A0A2K1QL66_9PEZI|nr:hypothetical protein CAC42_8012 [Sphaceloma murrayae]